MSKHTPGPWHVSDVDAVNPRIDGSDGRGIAHATQRDPHPITGQGISIQQAMANARLIAAAPDLLKALELCFKLACDRMSVPDAILVEDIIAKARGDK